MRFKRTLRRTTLTAAAVICLALAVHSLTLLYADATLAPLRTELTFWQDEHYRPLPATVEAVGSQLRALAAESPLHPDVPTLLANYTGWRRFWQEIDAYPSESEDQQSTAVAGGSTQPTDQTAYPSAYIDDLFDAPSPNANNQHTASQSSPSAARKSDSDRTLAYARESVRWQTLALAMRPAYRPSALMLDGYVNNYVGSYSLARRGALEGETINSMRAPANRTLGGPWVHVPFQQSRSAVPNTLRP